MGGEFLLTIGRRSHWKRGDADRDNDGWADGDAVESTVVFRTNASRGMYDETGVWIAVDLNGTGTLTTFVRDGAAAINYSDVSAVTFRTRLGGNVSRATTTPEGYPIYKNGSAGWVFIDLPGAVDVWFVAASGAPIPANATQATRNPYYLLAMRESLNWSLTLDQDPDDDGLIGAADPCPYVFDCDGDGIGDGEERANGTNLTDPDTDRDGLWDGPTVGAHVGAWVNGSNARMNDTDGDGLTDYQESMFSPDHVDNDGVWNWRDLESDGDGLNDTNEHYGWDITVSAWPAWWVFNGRNATLLDRRHVTSDPFANDTDLDGVLNFNEYLYGTDPGGNDTDFDGILDPVESTVVFRTNASRGMYNETGVGRRRPVCWVAPFTSVAAGRTPSTSPSGPRRRRHE